MFRLVFTLFLVSSPVSTSVYPRRELWGINWGDLLQIDQSDLRKEAEILNRNMVKIYNNGPEFGELLMDLVYTENPTAIIEKLEAHGREQVLALIEKTRIGKIDKVFIQTLELDINHSETYEKFVVGGYLSYNISSSNQRFYGLSQEIVNTPNGYRICKFTQYPDYKP